MHAHLEIIIPPVDNVGEVIRQIMEPFDENDNPNQHTFYDYYVIGGRWNGTKIETLLGEDRIEEFNKLLKTKKVTVSSLQFGKQSLNPPDQIPTVDKLWNDFFPESPIKQCPFFDHYKGDIGDVMKLKDIPKNLTAERVIIAKTHWEDEKKFEAGYMISESFWNGVDHIKTKWNSKVKSALDAYKKTLQTASEDYKLKNLPTPEWLCITIDYHS